VSVQNEDASSEKVIKTTKRLLFMEGFRIDGSCPPAKSKFHPRPFDKTRSERLSDLKRVAHFYLQATRQAEKTGTMGRIGH
jgi:hypothetical protein